MKTATALILAVALSGCASAPSATVAEDPEVFRHTYEFSGMVGGRELSGRIWFRPLGEPMPLELNMNFVRGGACRTEIRHIVMSRMVVGCGGIALDFIHGGRVPDRANVAWQVVEPQQRRACLRWTTLNTGQQTCSMWGMEEYNALVTLRGTVEINRAD
jgi:hypothetical protein